MEESLSKKDIRFLKESMSFQISVFLRLNDGSHGVYAPEITASFNFSWAVHFVKPLAKQIPNGDGSSMCRKPYGTCMA